ncbi:unnamed protein product [Linum tenue]|uniref:Uncharacterized protein n=1 Tax=Linum tenue TaxID=586396 RepID=A0AAV0HXA8_9ROSI|nr:unnamed protein product [Linum tenue]
MKGASKVIMGATVVMVVGLGFVLTLVLILLAELYCNLILRRRQHRQQMAVVSSPDTTTPITTIPSSPHSNLLHNYHHSSPSPPPLGVLQAPRSFLFPAAKEAKRLISSRRNSHHDDSCRQLHHVLELYDDLSTAAASPQQIGLIRTPPPPASYSFSPQEIREISVVVPPPHHHNNQTSPVYKDAHSTAEHFICISNPIYDNNKGVDHHGGSGRDDTPFETPDSSPSRLDSGGDVSSSSDEEMTMTKATASPPVGSSTPPLQPMKKLPAEATSVSLRDVVTVSGGTDSNSNNGLLSSSSSRSTSPSW